MKCAPIDPHNGSDFVPLQSKCLSRNSEAIQVRPRSSCSWHLDLPPGRYDQRVAIATSSDLQWRPRAIEAAPLAEDSAYVDKFRKLREERLDRLELYVQDLQSNQSPER